MISLQASTMRAPGFFAISLIALGIGACVDVDELGPDVDTSSDELGVVGEGWGTIVGQAGLCLTHDPSVLSPYGRASATMRPCTPGDGHQLWRSMEDQLKNLSAGQCLNIAGNEWGDIVQLYPCQSEPQPNETWYFADAGGGRQLIVNGGSWRCLNIAWASRVPGTPTVPFPCAWSPSDTWFVEPIKRVVQVRAILARRTNERSDASNPWITYSQFRTILAQLNVIYARAGIHFTISPADWIPYESNTLNALGGGTAKFLAYCNTAARAVVAQDPGKLNLFFTGTPGGFSGFTATDAAYAANEYVKMPYVLQKDAAPAEFLAHEIGHFFGLDHTAHDVPDGAVPAYDASFRLTETGGDVEAAFDADQFDDTLPDPGFSVNGCAGTDTISVWYVINGAFASLDVQTDRSNVMAYYFRCHLGPVTLTPSQLGRVRTTLSLRTHLP